MNKVPLELANTIVDPKAYGDGKRIDDCFTAMRKSFPLSIAEPEGSYPFWVVTQQADILSVSKQNDLYHSGDRPPIWLPIESEKRTRALMGGSPHLVRTLVHMDNPEHAEFRRVTNTWFQPQNLRNFEPRIREIAKGFVERMAEHGERCDFAADIAFLYPLHVIMEIMGVPSSDEPRMLRLTQELFGAADPEKNRLGKEVTTPEEFLAQAQATVGDFMEYFMAMTEDRKKCPRNDIASTIANGTVNGEPMGELEAMSYYMIVATAGHDTTSATTSGGMWALCENQDQFRKLKANPNLVPGQVDESLRWVTAVKHFMRSATADTELGGQKIAKGDWLWLAYPSGNRDEAVFDKPFSYDIERHPNRHIAFGYGGHACLGQHLAKMEMRIFWEELMARLESVELDGTPRNTDANLVCGPKTLPIRFKMK